jgi:hypothetical protein
MGHIFTPSNPEHKLSARIIRILGGISLFSVGVYLVFSSAYQQLGFPLDDAWIHQTYARNLALHGEWAFIPGQISGGSTSPLWSILLAIGYCLKIAPYFWTFLLGILALWGMAVLIEYALRRMLVDYHPGFPWGGAIIALEWHMAWAAASGMETLFFALLVTFTLVLVMTGSHEYYKIGLLIGISIWVRPEGVTLLGPVVLTILLEQSSWSRRLTALGMVSATFGSLFIFYLLFNLLISGSPFPNTFYAKQAEYVIYQNTQFIIRLGNETFQVLKGIGILILPGFVLALVTALRRKAWGFLMAAAWFIGFNALYAWRLPVTYQYGRYVMPAMPVYFLLGLIGLLEYISVHGSRWRWFITESWRIATAGVLIVFWVLGAIHYSQDVAFIENEMVATAKWISNETPPDALVAAHDIGALGYFGGHNLVDLAGLVSPEVIPFLRNETMIANYLNEREVTYLVAFPDWYQHLTTGLIPVFTTGEYINQTLGEENMTVYLWKSP